MICLSILLDAHPEADGQSEHSNALVEVMLCCLLEGQYKAAWHGLLPEVERCLNALHNASTGSSAFEILYGVKPWILKDTADPFLLPREDIRRAVWDASEMAQARLAIIYDTKHKLPTFRDKTWLRLTRQLPPP